jgi:DNA polymerase III epsilon subunit-like protein
MRKHNLAFIDIETTGLNLIKHEIIEIGCVITTPDLEVIEEFELKIKPEHISNADKVALKINQYKEDLWEDALSLKEALSIFMSKVNNCIMVGHNVFFRFFFFRICF